MDQKTAVYSAARDTISSKEGTAFMTVDGENIPLITLTECSAKWEKNKEEVQSIGRKVTANKTTSIKGTGTLSGHVINSNWAKYAVQLIKEGVDLYFDLTVTVEDKTTRLGKQTIMLIDVNTDDLPLIDLESDDGTLDFETDFTFEDMQLVTPFDDIATA